MFQFPRYATLFLLIVWSSRTYQNPLPTMEVVPPTPKELEEKYGLALEAIFGIGVRLEALLEDLNMPRTGNFLVSPLSIAMIVGQLMVGAEGKFRDELYNLLSLPESDDVKNSSIYYYNTKKNITCTLPYALLHLQMGALMRALEGKEIVKAFTLNTSNALFVNTHLKLKPEFVQNLKLYDTKVQPLNFTTDPVGSQKFINDWAANQTNGLIKIVLPSPLPASASALFTNAIYFRGDWETPFSYEANIKGPFYSTQDKAVEVVYMRGFFEDIPYGESRKLGCKMVAFPYKNNELAMYFMLPNVEDGKEFDVRKFADKLNAKDVLELASSLKKHKVNLQIPKMKLSNSLSVLKPLQKYHVFINKENKPDNETGDALDILEERVEEFESFNTTEDVDIYLTGAAENENLKITNILQEMTLSVDENGTEAAAVSLSIIDYIGGSKMLKLDRPFVFFIRHELTSAALFWGTIVDPTQSQ